MPDASARRWRLVMTIPLCIGLLVAPAALMAADTILWVDDGLQPAFIAQGPDRGQGILDGVVKIYQKRLTEYEHKHLAANMPRILELMRRGEKVCYAGFFKTPQREKFIYFSIPNIINYNNAIVVSKERKRDLFGDRNEVSLQTLLEKDRWVLGITRDRSYGGIIDGILERRGLTRANILMRAGTDSLKGLLAMASQGRIDCTIGFPWEVPYVARQMGLRDGFSIIHISETVQSRWILNYIGAPKTPWGRRLIDRINQILVEVRPTQEHMHHQLKWFPRNIETDLRQAYQEKILNVVP